MATLISYSTVEDYGYMKVRAKSGEQIRFPQPSKLSDPKIFLNAGKSHASVIRKNNINFTVKTKNDEELDLLVRYQLY